MDKLNGASAIVAAAGKGSRMKTDVNKQYLMLSNKPVLAYTLDVFERAESVSEIIVVIHPEDQRLFKEVILEQYKYSKLKAVVTGGEDRQASVYNGILKVSKECRFVLVHDGARPFISPNIINESVEVASKKGVACVGVPVKDTIKKVNQISIVEQTLDRSLLWSIQTPQTFLKDILVKSHEAAKEDGFRGTDDSMLAERLGYPIQMVMGNYNNIKITTPEDLVFASAIIESATKTPLSF